MEIEFANLKRVRKFQLIIYVLPMPSHVRGGAQMPLPVRWLESGAQVKGQAEMKSGRR